MCRVEVTVPASLHFHLLHLAKHSPLGVTVAEVAKTILVERVMQLIGSDFGKTVPPFQQPPSAANIPSTDATPDAPKLTT